MASKIHVTSYSVRGFGDGYIEITLLGKDANGKEADIEIQISASRAAAMAKKIGHEAGIIAITILRDIGDEGALTYKTKGEIAKKEEAEWEEGK